MGEVRRKRKRRKKSRKGLWITLVVLVIIAGAGYGGYYYMSHRDVQAEDIGVDQDFFDFSEFSDMDSGASGDLQDPGSGEEPAVNDLEQGTEDPTDDTSHNSTSNEAVSDQEEDHPGSSEDKLQEIEDKYTKVFKSLESTALGKLDTLAENALHDYRTGRSLADLSSTYMSAANKLQDKVDDAFYKLLDHMKAELKAAGYNNDLAKQAESEYKQAIADKKSEMLGKVTKATN